LRDEAREEIEEGVGVLGTRVAKCHQKADFSLLKLLVKLDKGGEVFSLNLDNSSALTGKGRQNHLSCP
jgi:hypothetical protein